MSGSMCLDELRSHLGGLVWWKFFYYEYTCLVISRVGEAVLQSKTHRRESRNQL